MDPDWLEVVHERSQFLFLKYWTGPDWEVAARPLVCLTLSALAIADARARKLSVAAMLVGTSGLAVAFIAGTIGPVPILLQGQAWRWMWVTSFVSILLLAPTLKSVWRDGRCGVLSGKPSYCAPEGCEIVAYTRPRRRGRREGRDRSRRRARRAR